MFCIFVENIEPRDQIDACIKGGNLMEPKIIKTLCGMEVKIIPSRRTSLIFDTKAIQIKHIDYYDPPYSSL